MKKINKKLILGTANLGSPYGINQSNLAQNNSFAKIFLEIKKRNTIYRYSDKLQKFRKKFGKI